MRRKFIIKIIRRRAWIFSQTDGCALLSNAYIIPPPPLFFYVYFSALKIISLTANAVYLPTTELWLRIKQPFLFSFLSLRLVVEGSTLRLVIDVFA